ncbi:WD40-repeat-containing domain protein [Earliella scabrosa]|nr:WD40-repeat-containing domain protein [Earliella scabrosa]
MPVLGISVRRLCLSPYYLLPFYIDHILRRDLPPGLKRLRIDLRHFSPFVLNLSLTDPITIPVAEWMELDQVIRYTGALCRHLEPIVISLPEAKPGITKAWTSALPGLLPTSTKAALYTVPQIIDRSPYDCRLHGPINMLSLSFSGNLVAIGSALDVQFWDTDLQAQRSGAGCTYKLGNSVIGAVFSSESFGYLVIAIVGMSHSGARRTLINSLDLNRYSPPPGGAVGLPVCVYREFQSAILTHLCYSSSKVMYMREDGETRVLDLRSRQFSNCHCSIPSQGVSQLRGGAFAVSSDEWHWVADWHRPGTMLVWNLVFEVPSVIWKYALPTQHDFDHEEVLATTFHSQNTALLAVTNRSMIWSWDVATGRPLHRPVRLRASLDSKRITFSRTGMRLGWISDDSSGLSRAGPDISPFMTVLDLSTATNPGQLIRLHGHAAPILAFAFSSDGHIVATASADHTVRLWRTRDGTCLETLTEHKAPVTQVAISVNGKVLASGAEDGTVRIRQMERVMLGEEENSYDHEWNI